MLADTRAATVFTAAPASLVLADSRSATFFTLVADTFVFADACSRARTKRGEEHYARVPAGTYVALCLAQLSRTLDAGQYVGNERRSELRP